jgi:hypothetical protein
MSMARPIMGDEDGGIAEDSISRARLLLGNSTAGRQVAL